MRQLLLTIILIVFCQSAVAQTAQTVIEQADKYPTDHVFINYQMELMTVDGVLYARYKFEEQPSMLVRYPAGRSESSFSIPDGVTRICAGAFDGVTLETLFVPQSVIYISFDAFKNAKIGAFKTTIDGGTTTTVSSPKRELAAEQVYDTAGVLQDDLQDTNRVYVVRLRNGKTVKVKPCK